MKIYPLHKKKKNAKTVLHRCAEKKSLIIGSA